MAILLIHTGGTIAMQAGPDGLAPSAGVLELGLAALPDASDVTIQRLDPLIDSAHATFRDWNRIAAAIESGRGRYGGFVVTHGTDTLAFTAAALSFSLQGLDAPVIVTGSMLPFGAAGSDAARNLGDALDAARRAPAGVWVQFAGKLLHGARARKAHSHRPEAFIAAPCDQPPRSQGPFARTSFRAPELAIVTMAPNQSAAALSALLTACDGVVLRVFGAGTMPKDPALLAALTAAHERGVLMIAVSQAPEGGTDLTAYAAGAALRFAVDGGGITLEAAYAKLAHVLSHDAGYKAQRARLAQDLCGEMQQEPR